MVTLCVGRSTPDWDLSIAMGTLSLARQMCQYSNCALLPPCCVSACPCNYGYLGSLCLTLVLCQPGNPRHPSIYHIRTYLLPPPPEPPRPPLLGAPYRLPTTLRQWAPSLLNVSFLFVCVCLASTFVTSGCQR